MKTIDELQWGPDGLLPVVISDAKSGRVLTLAYANREALQRTISERSTFLFSRSRSELWHKGATSGNTQRVVSVAYDCDADALLYRVEPAGPACHTGAQSCFDGGILLEDASGEPRGSFAQAMEHLRATLKQRRNADPETSYVAKLYAGGVDRIGKKIGEEATEVVIAAKNDSRDELVWEASDLLFHLLVMLEKQGIELDEIGAHLLERAK